MTTTPERTEEVISQIQHMIIEHLEKLYVERLFANTWIIADEDLRWTLQLLTDQLPEALQPLITHILKMRSLLHSVPIDRYYVQYLSDTHFVVRERTTDCVEPGPDDIVVCDELFTREDANCYARSMNELQRKLDLEYGRWTKHGAMETQQEEIKG